MIFELIEIPENIDGCEILVRGILHPFFYSESKKKLKEQAFMPPPNKCDVSVLRLCYTILDFCKAHSKALKIGDDSVYVGLAFVQAQQVKKAGEGCDDLVSVVYTPLIEKDLPMHADIFYNFVPAQGQPMPAAVKQIAKKLIQYPPTFLCVECTEKRPLTQWTGATQKEIAQKCATSSPPPPAL